MAKTAVGQWDTTAANNTDINSININEGMFPDGVNDAMRTIMSQIATWKTAAYFGSAANQQALVGSGTITPAVQIRGTTNNNSGLLLATFSTTASTGPRLDFYRSKDAAIDTATVVASGDRLGTIAFFGAQQTGTLSNQIAGVSIRAEVDGVVTSGASADMPGRLIIATTPDGSGTTTDRVLVDSTGLVTVGTATATPMALTWIDAGATIGPTLDLFRDSASPAVSDIMGSIDFNGRDSAANKQLYARITAVITDPVSTTEDASLKFWSTTNGTTTEIMSLTGASITMTGSVADKVFNQAADTDSLLIRGGNTGSGKITLYGPSHATLADRVAIECSNAIRLTQNTTDTPGSSNNTVGGAINGGVTYLSSAGSTLNVNRTTDGTNVTFASGGTTQGSISIAGATVSYNAFFGSHWSQLSDGKKRTIKRGTICESLDEMCAWPSEGNEDRLPRFKVSDKAGSKAVYGVFAWWDDDWTETNDAHIGALGAFVIRIAKDQTVQIGDYIESNGKGCGRVQADDIMRASTVAKVTSTTVVETYPDGSYLVPCTLHCG